MVAGVFASQDEADRAVEQMQRAGFGDAEIGVARGGDALGCRTETGITYETGAAMGGMTGAALGGLAGGPAGLLAGAVAGGLIGALIDLGIPEDAACFYNDEQQAGRTVVLVRSTLPDAAVALLGDHGATKVRRLGGPHPTGGAQPPVG
jgi:outer membrane lipoprotein SlyB